MSNQEAAGSSTMGVKLATNADVVVQAVAAFLTGAEPAVSAAGYTHDHVAAYRALCRHGEPVLLAAEDGAAYVSPAAGDAIEAALRAQRYRPAGGTLALRLPDSMGGGAGTYVLWASPKYLTAGTGSEQVWK